MTANIFSFGNTTDTDVFIGSNANITMGSSTGLTTINGQTSIGNTLTGNQYVAMSASGQYQTYVQGSGSSAINGNIYYSNDYGHNFNTATTTGNTSLTGNWFSIAISASGQ